MTEQAAAFDEAVSAASGLTPLDKVRLMERLASMLENDLSVAAGESPELPENVTPQHMTFKELAAWLNAHPPEESWGDLKDDEDAAEYVRRIS